MQSDGLIRRALTPVIRARLADDPVVAILGPRTAGKTVLARSLGGTFLDLDEEATRRAVAADPALAILAAPKEPVVFDEVQRAPEVLSAIKASLNTDLRPGRFVVTGSTRPDTVPELARSLAGRVGLVTLWPFSQGELVGRREAFIDRLFADVESIAQVPDDVALERPLYLQAILRGGFPLAIRRATPASRSQWFTDYVATVVQREMLGLRAVRDTAVVRRILQLAANRTAQLLNVAEIARAVDVAPNTAKQHLELLATVYLIQLIPAWATNLNARVVHHPKLVVTDSGLAAALTGVNVAKLTAGRPESLVQAGHLVETFVAGEIERQRSWSETQIEVFHFRTHRGVEVDLLLEAIDGSVAGIEIKATTVVRDADAAGLRFLRDRLGDRFVGGVILHTGQRGFRLDDRIVAAPLAALWT
jgi:uncharacterized protein